MPSTPQPAAAHPAAPARSPLGRSKVLSVRLTIDEFDRLSDQAEVLGVGPSTLARTFIRQGLSGAETPAGRAGSPGTSPLEAELLARLEARIAALERRVDDH